MQITKSFVRENREPGIVQHALNGVQFTLNIIQLPLNAIQRVLN